MPQSITKTRSMKDKTASLMIQGTCSNAGKSFIMAGICRALASEGVKVAPFKAQNMSLNSYVTLAGEEIGRAQALQAQACRLEPTSAMNPVLLKPNSQTGSQIILRGKPIANMEARRYFQFKKTLWQKVCDSYDELCTQYDAIILEGAGSPAEVNLKAHDIVNMRMARYAESPVLITADIDRGGAFAALIGTMACLDDWEQELTAGFILNKFRGDASLLSEALEYTTSKTGKPFLGVLPFLQWLGLPEEDSVTFKESGFSNAGKDPDSVDLAVIDLPHISNFTDFDALGMEPDVRPHLVSSPEELLSMPVDCIVLPGSKSTLSDLDFLHQSGLGQAIVRHVDQGGMVVGICAGFQMLGTTVADPHGMESGREQALGLDLLPFATEIQQEKTLTRTKAKHLPSKLDITGYEIHHGLTSLVKGREKDVRPIIEGQGRVLGMASETGLVWGSYIHGLFDEDEFRRHFIDGLRTRKGLAPKNRILARYSVEQGLDRLALAIKEHLDWDRIKEAMGL